MQTQVKTTQSVQTYTLPPDVTFLDVLETFDENYSRPAGDDLFLIDNKFGARLVARSLQALDLFLYNPFTLETLLIATFEPYQGKDEDCETWEDLEWAIARLGLIEQAKTFERLMGIAALQTQRIVVIQ